MARAKKIKEIEEAVSTTPLPENVVVKFDRGIEVLNLNHNLGRQDLDEAFKKVEEKINEIIKKVN